MANVNSQDLTNGIEIETTSGRKFSLLKADFPIPVNPDDRVEVEEKIQQMLDNFAQGEFVTKIHIYSLNPLQYNIRTSNEESDERWWRH